MTGKLALPTLIALCSIALGRPTVSTLAVLGEIKMCIRDRFYEVLADSKNIMVKEKK